MQIVNQKLSTKSNYKYDSFQFKENSKTLDCLPFSDSRQIKKSSPVNSKLAIVYFGGSIRPATRLAKSNHAISNYIQEIYKARWLHGDKAVIDLSMGNPDLTPPEKAKQALKAKVNDLWSHRYNSPKGESNFLNEVSVWMKKRFGVKINPKTEVMVTSGSSDAVDHIFSAYANFNDKVLIPNPGYSLYDDLINRHDLVAVPYDLHPEKGYLPDFEKISKQSKDAKIMILNYPHNPTGSFATKQVYDDAVKFAKKHGILIINDVDNSEITHSGQKALTIMQSEGAKDVAFQIHTFSKAQSMPGLRVAFAVSNEQHINNLLQAKYLSGGSVYTPVQAAAAEALIDSEHYIDKVNNIYKSRKNTCIERLNKLGSNAKPTDGTYYLWAKIPDGFTSDEFFKYTLHKAHVALTPGTVFGKNGEGYVRIVMSADESTINKAFDNIEKAGIRFDVSKNNLPIAIQEEIKQMASDNYLIKPKAERDFEQYIVKLKDKIETLKVRFANLDDKFALFLPKENNITNLPANILKEGQSVYLQNLKHNKPLLGEVKDILPFSHSEYDDIYNLIKKDWFTSVKDSNPTSEILPVYKVGKFYSDATYFTLRADNKLQAIGNLEIQPDNCLWVRCLNSAPWNQGKNSEIRGSGTSIMARMVSFCMETGNDTLKLATDKPQNVHFYKTLGMKEDGIRIINGSENTVLYFDKENMQKFLDKFKSNLSF